MRKYRTRLNPGKRNSGRVLSPAEKKIFDKSQKDTDQKVTDQKPRDKVVKKILDRNAKKNKERMKIPNRIQSDRRRLLRGMKKGEVMLDEYIPLHEERYKRSPKLKKYDDFLDDARNASTPEKKLNYVRKATKEHNQVKKSSPKDIQ